MIVGVRSAVRRQGAVTRRLAVKPTGTTAALLAGLGLWTWLLAFPFFGPLLPLGFGASARVGAFAFAAGHAGGLLLWSWRTPWRRPHPAIYAALLALTAACFLTALPPAAVAASALLLGLLSAGAVIGWVRQTAGARQPGLALAGAGAGANVVLWGLGLTPAPGGTPRILALGLLAAALACLWLGQLSWQPAAPPRRAAATRGVLPPTTLVVFAVAAYVGGGIVYGLVTPLLGTMALARWVGVWPYILAFGVAAWRTPQERLDRLVTWVLATLGVGFVVLATGPGNAGLFALVWTLVMGGLGLADAYYWRRVIGMVRATGALAVAGSALAWNVVVVAGTAYLTSLPRFGAVAHLPLSAAAAAAVLFGLTPLLAAGRMEAATAAAAGPSGDRPADLTRTEVQVFELLLRGHTDTEIGTELHVSRNTVKFHVRNVLHKSGCANRKVLRARYAARATGTAPRSGGSQALPAQSRSPAP